MNSFIPDLNSLHEVLLALEVEPFFLAESQFKENILAQLQASQVKKAALTSDPLLIELGLWDILLHAGFQVVAPLSPVADPVAAGQWRDEVASSEVGITSALALAQETGSALLTAAFPDERAVSLLPPWHILIIRQSQIVLNIAALMNLWCRDSLPRKNAVIITGPSRTADIEKELVLGVHGPGKMSVIIII